MQANLQCERILLKIKPKFFFWFCKKKKECKHTEDNLPTLYVICIDGYVMYVCINIYEYTHWLKTN